MSTREEVNALKDELFTSLDVAAAADNQANAAAEAFAKAQQSLDTANENLSASKMDVESKKQLLKEAIDSVT